MKTPTEKAKELVDKFSIDIRPFSENGEWSKGQAKQCALIAVEELIKHLSVITNVETTKEYMSPEIELDVNFWIDVKTEIEKL